MSFNINGPSNQPIIQASQNLGKDGGGGGNTGYMNMRKKKKGEEKNTEEDNSVFLEGEPDTFEKEKKNKKENKFLGAISKFIKDKNANKDSDTFSKSEKDDDAENKNETSSNASDELIIDEVPEIFNTNVSENYYDDIDV